jgi:dienelactone hydrolase
MQETFIPYTDHETQLEGYAVHPSQGKHPTVILCHGWRGRDAFICEKTKLIASSGYVGFALDIFGKGILGNSKEENTALKKPFLDDRKLLQNRVLKAFEVVSQLPYVDPDRIAILGFGFGGLCALDLARAGVNLLGAISVYGHFEPPPSSIIKPIKAKVLVLHGYDDPITPQNELRTFEKEMTDAKVDWQAHIYGGTLHAFVTPAANDPGSGILYNPIAAQRAWLAIDNFLGEIFTVAISQHE